MAEKIDKPQNPALRKTAVVRRFFLTEKPRIGKFPLDLKFSFRKTNGICFRKVGRTFIQQKMIFADLNIITSIISRGFSLIWNGHSVCVRSGFKLAHNVSHIPEGGD